MEITQELAQRSKVGSSTVADFERGKRVPVPANIEAIATALEAAGIQFVAGGVQGPAPSGQQKSMLAAGSPVRLVDATDLSQWATRHDAKGYFPELIERLILASTGNIPKRLQFPSGDSVQQPGWDGICEQDINGNFNWLPLGVSGWELGTQGGSLLSKAEEDYTKRTLDPLALSQQETTFTFATPRRWKAGAKWAEEKRTEKVWKDVRVLDGDDLVSWIALFPAVGYWLAARIGKLFPGTTPLSDFWSEWRLSTEWPMSPALVLAGRDDEAIELLKWLYGSPGIRNIQGDSAAEAIAFLYAAIDQLPEEYRKFYLSRCLIASTPEVARSLGNSPSPLVIIIEASEPGLAARLAQQGHHVLVTYGSRVGTTDLVNVLSRPGFEPFQDALEQMGVPRPKANALTRDSARKISILRRLIPSAAGALTPVWAEGEKGNLLVPALLAGAWDEDYEGDRAVLESLSGETFEGFSARCPGWIDFPDAPLRHAGKTWKIASPYDAWFRLAGFISKRDLERFNTVAQTVLGAADPRFEMDSDERWLAGVRGQGPKYSPWLVSGITETLLLLAMYGNQIRAVHDAPLYADMIVRGLLGNADERRWWSLASELRTLAEVSPETFMSAVEESLSREEKPVMVLFKEDGGPLFGRAYHSNLLWALETLAWSPEYLSRVAEILARLARLDPGGRYANRPKNSLRSIFLLWLPQTNATCMQRLAVIDRLRRVEPMQAWNLMLGIFPKGYDTSSYNPRPKWRDFEVTEPEVVTNRLIFDAATALAERLIDDASTDPDRWAELIDHLAGFSPECREKGWIRLTRVSAQIQKDEQRLPIWAALRKLISHHRSFSHAEWALRTEEIARVEVIYQQFSPVDSVLQRSWLFSHDAPLLQGRRVGEWEVRDKELADLRKQAVAELLAQSGFSEVRRLVEKAKVPFFVGVALLEASATPNEARNVLNKLVEDDAAQIREFVRGLVAAGSVHYVSTWGESLLSMAKAEHWSEAAIVRVLLALPSDRKIWDSAASFGEEVNKAYWERAEFFLRTESTEDKLYMIEQLIAVGRAAHVVERIAASTDGIPSSRIVDLLTEAATGPWPDSGNNAVMFQWAVGELLKKLEADGTTEDAVIARLEWMYLALLEHSERTPIVLHRFMATDPSFFVQVLSAVFRPHSESEPKEHKATEQEKAMATQAFRLLQSWETVPGGGAAGLDPPALTVWVEEAHRLAVQAERGAVGDQYIGRILSFAPEGTDGIWPDVAVRNVIEDMRNVHVENGILVGIHNQRGVTSRGMFDGGTLERELVKKYNSWSDATKLEWPRTSSLLRQIARSFENSARHFDEQAERTDWEY